MNNLNIGEYVINDNFKNPVKITNIKENNVFEFNNNKNMIGFEYNSTKWIPKENEKIWLEKHGLCVVIDTKNDLVHCETLFHEKENKFITLPIKFTEPFIGTLPFNLENKGHTFDLTLNIIDYSDEKDFNEIEM